MVEKVIKWVLMKLDGKKRIIALIASQYPWMTENPLVYEAFKNFLNDPTNVQGVAFLLAQLLLAWGVLDGLKKWLS